MENISENSNLSLDVITNVVDNQLMWDKFEETVDALKRGRKVSDNSLKAAMGVVMVSVVLKKTRSRVQLHCRRIQEGQNH